MPKGSRKRKADAESKEVAKKQKTAQSFLATKFGPVLATTPVTSLLKEKPKRALITLAHNITVAEALQTLAKERILSSPVELQMSLEDGESDTYLGMIDYGAVLHYFLREIPAEVKASERKARISAFFERKLITITGDDIAFVHKAETEESVGEVIKGSFFTPDRVARTHRVAIFSPRGSIIGIISQSDVVKFLHTHLNEARTKAQLEKKDEKKDEKKEEKKDEKKDEEKASKSKKKSKKAKEEEEAKELAEKDVYDMSVGELGLGTSPVQTVPDTATALEAFRVLHNCRFGGIGVVDKDGKLVANLSASDMRGVTAQDFDLLNLPVLKFLQTERKIEEKKIEGTGVLQPISTITTTADASFHDVLHTFAKSRIHRLYVVDKDHKPTAVITLTNILKLFV